MGANPELNYTQKIIFVNKSRPSSKVIFYERSPVASEIMLIKKMTMGLYFLD